MAGSDRSCLQIRGRGSYPGSVAAPGTIVLSNVNIAGACDQYAMALHTYSTATGISMSGVNITATSPWGLFVEELGLTPHGTTLNVGNTLFNGTHTPQLTLGDVSLADIDATGATFSTVLASTACAGLPGAPGPLWTIEDKVVHSIDAAGGGRVTVCTNNWFVTPISFAPPVTTTPSVQRGVDTATAGDTVWVKGDPNPLVIYPSTVAINKALTVIGQNPTVPTAIDLSGNPTGGTVVTIPGGTTGNVTFKGFSLVTGPAATVNSNGIHVTSPGASGGTVTIQNNEIHTVQSAAGTAMENYGFIAGYGSTSALLFDNNKVYGGGDNPVLIERWLGQVDFTNNTVYRGPDDSTTKDAIFVMNYGASNITTLQRFEGNTIDMSGGTVFTGGTQGAALSVVAQYTGGAGPGGYTNVLIKNNQVVNLKPFRRGLGLWDNSSGPGDITASFVGNTISAVSNASPGAWGLRVLGGITGTTFTGNTVSGAIEAFKAQDYNGFPPTGLSLTGNTFDGTGVAGAIGVHMVAGSASLSTNIIKNNATAGIKTETGDSAAATRNHIFGNGTGYNNADPATQTATCNWWGSGTGPGPVGPGSGDTITTNVNAATWLLFADFGVDTDGDTYTSCTSDSGGDCAPTIAAINPGATEVCNGIDDNCVAGIDEGGNALCQNGQYCDGVETCGGLSGCLPGPGNPCNDGNICTVNNCVELTDTCDYTTPSGSCGLGGHVYYNLATGPNVPPSVPSDSMDTAKGVVNVTMTLTGGTAGVDLTDPSPNAGLYGFTSVAGNLLLKPSKTVNTLISPNDWDKGLASADASAIAKYAVGLITMSPNQLIAGDVSNNGLVSSFDASQVAQKVANPAFVFPVRTATGNDFAFIPVSASFTPITGPTTTDFTALLYGDVTGNWTSPESIDTPAPPVVTSSGDALPAPVRAASANGAVLYMAGSPIQTSDGHWQVTLGLQDSDGIIGLDMQADV